MVQESIPVKSEQINQPEADPVNAFMQAAVLYGAKDIRIESVGMPELLPGMVLIKIRRAGICGSDLHYYQDGYIGSFIPSRPFIPGHELVGHVVAVSNDNLQLYPPAGARVTVNPARACAYCDYCKSGRANLCAHTIMLGSASTVPPTNGAFAGYVAVRADQCFELPDAIDDATGALIEPLAVALHALKQAGNVSGKQVLVTGGETIGLLTAFAARAYGAASVAVSDVVAERRKMAIAMGADAVFNPAEMAMMQQAGAMAPAGFDIILEASGAPAALQQAFGLVKRGGTIVQIGSLGREEIPLPANQLMVKEIRFIGSFRYTDEFPEAIRLAASGRISLQPFITGIFPLQDVANALAAAMNRVSALKVQLDI